jgi:hypothetical protein
MKQTLWLESLSELYRPSNNSMSEKLVPTFEDRGCSMVSATDPHGRNLGFIDRVETRSLFILRITETDTIYKQNVELVNVRKDGA